jgi:F-box-like
MMGASHLPLEILDMIIEHVETPRDLFRCLRVNSTWNAVASRKLYRGSINDTQFRTPEIEMLMCQYVASRHRFTRNMSFVRHMVLSPEIPTVDISAFPHTRLSGYDKGCSVRYGTFAEHFVNSFGGRLESLAIPFEFMGGVWEGFTKLLFSPSIEFLAIDGKYCEVMLNSHLYTHTIKPYLDVSFAQSTPILPRSNYLTLNRVSFQISKLLQSTDQTADRVSRSFANS